MRSLVLALIVLLFVRLPFAADRASADSAPTYAIRAEPIPMSDPPNPDAKALPAGVVARFPSFDGDTFAASFPSGPAGALTADRVLRDSVMPVLKAMGFGARLSEITPPRADHPGFALPAADLAALAAQTCLETDGEAAKEFETVCDAMRTGRLSADAEGLFQAAYGLSFAQFKADIERRRIDYVFVQRPRGVPIEHSAIVATRWDGEAVTSLHGTLFNRYHIANRVVLRPEKARAVGQARLLMSVGLIAPTDRAPRPAVQLVLLPYGRTFDRAGAEIPALRHAYRTLLFAKRQLVDAKGAENLSWMAWIDAEDGRLLKLTPQFAAVSARGPSWRRDPTTTPVTIRTFEVDAASDGYYWLQWSGVFNRVDRFGDLNVDSDHEVRVAVTSPGSSATLANFDQPAINQHDKAWCAAGPNSGNDTFRQVNAFAHLYSYRQLVVAAGSFPPFPESPVTVWVDHSTTAGNRAFYDGVDDLTPGQSVLRFIAGTGFGSGCPDAPDVSLPGTHDATTLIHEFAHLSTKRLQERRPADWCGPSGCPVPDGRELFHDFADAVAMAYASIPCQGGWTYKNLQGANASKRCAKHVELRGVPRLASVREPIPAPPFTTLDPLEDRFPERRKFYTTLSPEEDFEYADMQIASAALWLTRAGMRSKRLAAGTVQYWVRFNRALWDFGRLHAQCAKCDRDIYRFLQNLLFHLAKEWTSAGTGGDGTINKLLSAWARVGVFLVPARCIDSTPWPSLMCPRGGGDAIVDVDDNDDSREDDRFIDGVRHPEVDYIRRGAAPPTFRVWTGPRYRFDASGQASEFRPSTATPAPCNSEYQVELATDRSFTANVITSSTAAGWRPASRTTHPECYDRWTPDPAVWQSLVGSSGYVKVYYRVRTRRTPGGPEKISTSPGNGLHPVPPPFVVVNDTGRP